jgi:uncharacterized membrane protein
MGNSSNLRVAAVVCLALVPAGGARAFGQSAPTYEAVDLTALAGGERGEAYDVNDLGEIVMTLENEEGFNGYAWSEAGGLQILTDPGWYYLIPQAINDSGTVTGLGLSLDPWGVRAFVRAPDGTVSRLNNPLPDPSTSSWASGLNEAGWAVGGGPSTGGGVALLWWPPGYSTIAILSGYSYYGEARDVNDYVQGNGDSAPVVVGSQTLSGSYVSAVCWGCFDLWTPLDLGVLEPNTNRHANGVNDLNHIVGESCSGLDCKAFLWTGATDMTELAGLPGSTFSTAEDINEADWVAGTSESDGADQAVIWSPAGQVFELPSLSGALSSVAHAVNESGWVVGRTRVCTEEVEGECIETVDHATLWRPLSTAPEAPAELILEAAVEVEALEAAGILNKGQANSLLAKLGAAYKKIEQGKPAVAVHQLEAFIHEVEAMLRSGRLTPEHAEPLIDLAQQAIDGLTNDGSG